MLEQNKNPVSPFVNGQVPEFVRIDHPSLIAFLTAYYEWLDKDTTYLRSPKRLKEVVDIDQTMDEFVGKFKKEFLFEFPETLAITDDKTLLDTTKLVKNIRSFYKAKGTEKTYDFLFRILYDTAVEFYYPKKDILKLSDGKWILRKTIKLSNALGTKIYDSLGTSVIQKNNEGEIIASGRVLDVSTYRIGIYDVAELSLGGINGEFESGYYGIEFTDQDGNLRKENRVFSVIGDITITSGGSNYKVGDTVVFTPSGSDTGVKAAARVSEVDSSGSIKKITIDNFGINYKIAPTITVESEIGTGFAGTVTVKGQAEYPGYYANNDGRLSSNKVMQDNRYYQDFSYVLLTEITIDRYRDVIRRLLNPAGMAFYGKVLLKRCAYTDLNQATSLIEYDVPIIGHYLPYTFLTHDDLNKWFRKVSVVNGEVISEPSGYNRTRHTPPIQYDLGGVPDGKVDLEDYSVYLENHPDASLNDFFHVIGNPFASGISYQEPDSSTPPLGLSGQANADPFWIVYQHPNRRMSDPVVARIPYDLKDEFLTDHGAASVFGYPTPTGACGHTGYWREWTESVTANREEWATGFTSGERYVMLSYNPLVPFYGPISSAISAGTSQSLTAYRQETTGPEGNPTFLYDPFTVEFRNTQPSTLVDFSVFLTQTSPLYGPKLIGGKPCYRFTDEILAASTAPTLQQIVDSLDSWLQSNGLNRQSQEYVMIDLNNIFIPSKIQPTYAGSFTDQQEIEDKNQILSDMVVVLKLIKLKYPLCRFGYNNWPRIPNFVNVVEDLYRSLENLPNENQKALAIEAAENVKALIREQDVMYLDCHFRSPSIQKNITKFKRLLDASKYLNETFVGEGIERKFVIMVSSRLYKTNGKDTPNFFISSLSDTRKYLPEYSAIKASVFYSVWEDILNDSDYGCRLIDGFYNDLNPSFLLDALMGSTGQDAVFAPYSKSPNIFNQDRSTNGDNYQIILRRAMTPYLHYALGYTGATGENAEFYSATGPTALCPSYWFPLGDKKIVGYTGSMNSFETIRYNLANQIVMPLYCTFNSFIAREWAFASPTSGNLDTYSAYSQFNNSPEVPSTFAGFVLGDADGSGVVDTGDLALLLLGWGEYTGASENFYDAPWDYTPVVQGIESTTNGELLGYNIAYSDFRKITARAFFSMPVGKEFNCTNDQVKAPPFPQVYAEKMNGLTAPAANNYDYREPANLVTGGKNLILNLEAVRGITGTPQEGVSTLVYLGYYGIRSLWAELYAVKPSDSSGPEKEYMLANAGPFSPTSTLISINSPFPNFENPDSTGEMFTANYFDSNGPIFRFRGQDYHSNRHFMRLKLVFRNSANAVVPEATKVMDFNYNKTS